MIMRTIAALLLPAVVQAAGLRVASFKVDATPPAGEPNIWITPVAKIADPLWAKGIVLEADRTRYVLCVVDWCGIGGSTHRLFRDKAARAAGTDATRVAIHVVHQHSAPYVEGDAYGILRGFKDPPLLMSDAYLERLTDSIAAAVSQAANRLQPFDSIGAGAARVERVASSRRILSGGKVLTRYSGSGKDPRMAAFPEGEVDTEMRTITLAQGRRPLVRLHYYATHPQTFCCDGVVSGDFVNDAREALENKEGIPQIYFTGAAGNVTVGKYNDGSRSARAGLAERLRRGMEASIAATGFQPARTLVWRPAQLHLPAKAAPAVEGITDGAARYRAATGAAFANRKTPLDVNLLEIGSVAVLHLPGEPMLEFQNFARAQRPGRFVAVAGYGEISPGYLCTDEAHAQGGYEPSASFGAPGTEAAVKKVIQELMRRVSTGPKNRH
jgi:hypothetical protein